MEVCAENQMGSDLTGVYISMGIDGPVSSHRNDMIEWKPEILRVQVEKN